MREICKSGSEGGGIEYNRSSLPLCDSPGRRFASPGTSPEIKTRSRESGGTRVDGRATVGGPDAPEIVGGRNQTSADTFFAVSVVRISIVLKLRNI